MPPDARAEGLPPEPDTDALARRLAVSRETAARLRRFVALLGTWNRRINLVAPNSLPLVWDRHVADSLQLLPLLGRARPARGLDLGSGAGFPGLVLAIAGDIPMTLIEADRRKAAFLRAAIAETGAPAEVCEARIERCDPDAGPRPAIITARALKPLPELLQLAAPWLADGRSVLWAWKGARWREELTAAQKGWIFDVRIHPSRTEAAARLLAIRNLRAVRGKRAR